MLELRFDWYIIKNYPQYTYWVVPLGRQEVQEVPVAPVLLEVPILPFFHPALGVQEDQLNRRALGAWVVGGGGGGGAGCV